MLMIDFDTSYGHHISISKGINNKQMLTQIEIYVLYSTNLLEAGWIALHNLLFIEGSINFDVLF